jgi:hypothetical protein
VRTHYAVNPETGSAAAVSKSTLAGIGTSPESGTAARSAQQGPGMRATIRAPALGPPSTRAGPRTIPATFQPGRHPSPAEPQLPDFAAIDRNGLDLDEHFRGFRLGLGNLPQLDIAATTRRGH